MTSILAAQSEKTKEFIRKAVAAHASSEAKYDYSKVEYTKASEKVTIACLLHGEFAQTPKEHLKGYGCKKCGIAKAANARKHTKETFIEKARAVHGDKYDYSQVTYINNKTAVTIVCKTHGEFTQSPNSHLRGYGCATCACKSQTKQYSVESWIAAARKIHGDTYDYSKITEYKGAKQKLPIICKIHGEFLQCGIHHLRMSGCKKCGKSTTDEFVAKAIVIHGKDKYDYSQVKYINSRGMIELTCKKHAAKSFFQRADKHLAGQQGCQKCMMCPGCELWKTHGALCDYCKTPAISKKYEKTKEIKVVAYLRAEFPEHHFTHNKSVGKDCTDGHLFPDVCYDRDKFFLIIEIDEHKHRGASYKCDESRMCDITAKLGLPCVFIRYNPDAKTSDIATLRTRVAHFLAAQITDEKSYETILGIKDSTRGFIAEYLFY